MSDKTITAPFGSKEWFPQFARAHGHSWPLVPGSLEHAMFNADFESYCSAMQAEAEKVKAKSRVAKPKDANDALPAAQTRRGAAAPQAKAERTARTAAAREASAQAAADVLAIVAQRTKKNPIARTDLPTLAHKKVAVTLAAQHKIGRIMRDSRTFYYKAASA